MDTFTMVTAKHLTQRRALLRAGSYVMAQFACSRSWLCLLCWQFGSLEVEAEMEFDVQHIY